MQKIDQIPASSSSSTQEKKTAGLAIVALVLGVLAVLTFPILIFGVAALITGIAAMSVVNKPANHLKGSDMAQSGVILGGLSILFFVVALPIALLLPALDRGRIIIHKTLNSSQLRGHVTGLFSYAESNRARYPGIGQPDADDDGYAEIYLPNATAPADTNASGADLSEGCHVEARYYELLFRNYFTGELAINPFDRGKTVWTTGPVTADHYSYAMLHIGEDDSPLARRAVEWGSTGNSQAIVFSDRNVAATMDKADVQSLMTDQPGDWLGEVAFNDNHVERITEPVYATKYGDVSITRQSHAEFADVGDYLFDAGETDDQGEPVGDRPTGDGAYMIYQGTGP